MTRVLPKNDTVFAPTDRMGASARLGSFGPGLAAPAAARNLGWEDKHDRRLKPRYRPVTGAFALLRPVRSRIRRIHTLSMADIALAVFRSNPAKYGQIADISTNGLAFTYVADDRCCSDKCVLDILIAESGFYLQNLRFDIVSDLAFIEDIAFDCFKTGRLSLQFTNLTQPQTEQIFYFLEHHTVGTA